MRKIIIGDYDTELHGPWTLSAWSLSPAIARSEYIEIPGMDGALDVSDAMTGGEPTYSMRTFTATLERSDLDRLAREDAITEIINRLDGRRLDIHLPDDETHHITGRVHVARSYNDPAHGSVTIEATVEPWKVSDYPTTAKITAQTGAQTVRLDNRGRRLVIPSVTASGTVHLVHGGDEWTLSEGTYKLPDLTLRPGVTEIIVNGEGDVLFTWTEALL